MSAYPPVSSVKINGFDTAALHDSMDAIGKAHKQRRRFRVRNEWLHGGHTRTVIKDILAPDHGRISRARPLVLESDVPSLTAAHDRPVDPLEYLLVALAASVTAMVAWHAAAAGIHAESIETRVEGDVDLRESLALDADAHRGFTHIRIYVAMAAEACSADLDTLIAVVRHHSPLVNMITQGARVTISREPLK